VAGADHADRRAGIPGPPQPARPAINRSLKYGVKQAFLRGQGPRRPGSSNASRASAKAPTRPQGPAAADYFEPHPRRRPEDDPADRRGIRRRNPATRPPGTADERPRANPPGPDRPKPPSWAITAIRIPEDFDGIAAHRSTVTNALVAESLAYGGHGSCAADPGARRRRVGAQPTVGKRLTSRPPI